MRRSARRAALLGVAGSLLAAVDAAAQGCAMCGTVLGADAPRTVAFQWSILFLMAVPYALAGGIGAWLYLAARRSRTTAAGRDAAEARLGGLTTD